MQDEAKQASLSDTIRDATWCQCTQFTAEAEEAIRRADAVEAERDRYRDELERLQEIVVRASRLAEQERCGLTQQVLQEAFACNHGEHKLIPWTDPATTNLGHCVRCGTVHPSNDGAA